jgi:hypothetical protein
MSTQVRVDRYPDCGICKELARLGCRTGSQVEQAAYDGKTIYGLWAYMCATHFDGWGIGLGTGRGQKLVIAP